LQSFFLNPGGQLLVDGVGVLVVLVGSRVAVSVERASAGPLDLATRDVACGEEWECAVGVLCCVAGGPATLLVFPPDSRSHPTARADTTTAQTSKLIAWTNDNSLTRLATRRERARGLQPSARECRPPMTSSVARIFPITATRTGSTA
jgi:hypothetical protein